MSKLSIQFDRSNNPYVKLTELNDLIGKVLGENNLFQPNNQTSRVFTKKGNKFRVVKVNDVLTYLNRLLSDSTPEQSDKILQVLDEITLTSNEAKSIYRPIKYSIVHYHHISNRLGLDKTPYYIESVDNETVVESKARPTYENALSDDYAVTKDILRELQHEYPKERFRLRRVKPVGGTNDHTI